MFSLQLDRKLPQMIAPPNSWYVMKMMVNYLILAGINYINCYNEHSILIDHLFSLPSRELTQK